jgi:hypothetical protein
MAVAVGNNGTLRASADGVTWTVVASPTTQNLYGVAYAGSGIWTAVGAKGTLLTSSDGLNWSLVCFRDNCRSARCGSSGHDALHLLGHRQWRSHRAQYGQWCDLGRTDIRYNGRPARRELYLQPVPGHRKWRCCADQPEWHYMDNTYQRHQCQPACSAQWFCAVRGRGPERREHQLAISTVRGGNPAAHGYPPGQADRRALTAVDKMSSDCNESSHPRHASVILLPVLQRAGIILARCELLSSGLEMALDHHAEDPP